MYNGRLTADVFFLSPYCYRLLLSISQFTPKFVILCTGSRATQARHIRFKYQLYAAPPLAIRTIQSPKCQACCARPQTHI